MSHRGFLDQCEAQTDRRERWAFLVIWGYSYIDKVVSVRLNISVRAKGWPEKACDMGQPGVYQILFLCTLEKQEKGVKRWPNGSRRWPCNLNISYSFNLFPFSSLWSLYLFEEEIPKIPSLYKKVKCKLAVRLYLGAVVLADGTKCITVHLVGHIIMSVPIFSAISLTTL